MIGLLSFMTSDEMTTGSISATEHERRRFAAQTRWWNSTGGGSTPKTIPGIGGSNASGFGNVKAGDGGEKFKSEWPELDEQNWSYMKLKRIDPKTGRPVLDQSSSCTPEANPLRRRPLGSNGGLGMVVEGGQHAREAGQGWLASHKLLASMAVFVGWVVLARLFSHSNA